LKDAAPARQNSESATAPSITTDTVYKIPVEVVIQSNDSNLKYKLESQGSHSLVSEKKEKPAVSSADLPFYQQSWYLLIGLTLLVMLAIMTCYTLTNIYVLSKKESRITWCQIFILIFIGLWIIGVLVIIDVKSNPRFAAALGIAGSILTWIFQDTVKGVATFIHLRLNNLLNIDDWIKIPKHNVDGTVTRVSLTTVTIYNWDTTTSTVPISILHSDHFINLQKMRKGKTYGRRMFKSFIIDTNWIHIMSSKEIAELRQSEHIREYLSEEDLVEGNTNAHIFRLYLYHWLMNHPHISQQPRLVVRWMEHAESGMPLQVYAFIIDSTVQEFEWQQSQIIEHIMESLMWFGLRLYQSPSAYDVSNSNIYLTKEPADYRNPS